MESEKNEFSDFQRQILVLLFRYPQNHFFSNSFAFFLWSQFLCITYLTGGYHGMVIMADAKLYSWGWNGLQAQNSLQELKDY
jgi:hypothetical protein